MSGDVLNNPLEILMSVSMMPARESSPNLLYKAVLALMVFGPLLAILLLPFFWQDVFVKEALIQLPIWYVITVTAITVSFHRELTHGSLELKPIAKYPMVVLALLALEGRAIDWCANHRKHHHYSDKEGDPHSPNLHGESIWGIIKGWGHGHVMWLFSAEKPDHKRYVPDLLEDRTLRALDRLFPLWAVLTFLLPGLSAYALLPTWKTFWVGVLWGGVVRVFLVHHMTWSINSICHLWGTRPFRSRDKSVNNFFFGYLAAGEGWHRNHHAFARSARIGLRWWEFDWGWIVIRILNFFGLVKRYVVPDASQIEAKRIR
ncbi:MAG: fatty acid desaturase [Parcubacteria group bacterium]